jgi:hypothetical protein
MSLASKTSHSRKALKHAQLANYHQAHSEQFGKAGEHKAEKFHKDLSNEHRGKAEKHFGLAEKHGYHPMFRKAFMGENNTNLTAERAQAKQHHESGHSPKDHEDNFKR